MDHQIPRDRRLDRRIPVNCGAFIMTRGGEQVEAECTELSVSGMTLRADYVPAEGEVIEVALAAPNETLDRPPLMTRLRVTRCYASPKGAYEIGGAIVRVVG